MTAIVEEVAKKPIPAHQRHLIFEVCVQGDDDDDDAAEPEVPYILYKLPHPQ